MKYTDNKGMESKLWNHMGIYIIHDARGIWRRFQNRDGCLTTFKWDNETKFHTLTTIITQILPKTTTKNMRKNKSPLQLAWNKVSHILGHIWGVRPLQCGVICGAMIKCFDHWGPYLVSSNFGSMFIQSTSIMSAVRAVMNPCSSGQYLNAVVDGVGIFLTKTVLLLE